MIVLFIASCKKDNTPPVLTLKAGVGYTSGDVTVSPGDAFIVRMVMNKGADDLSEFYTEVAFDGSNLPRLVSRVYIGPNDRIHFERDVTVHTRNQAGNERWVFNVNDADGRISTVEIRVSVQ